MTRSLALATLVVSEEKARKHSEEEEGPRLLIPPRALLFADCKLRVLSLRARARVALRKDYRWIVRPEPVDEIAT